jgi:hypothetical protein
MIIGYKIKFDFAYRPVLLCDVYIAFTKQQQKKKIDLKENKSLKLKKKKIINENKGCYFDLGLLEEFF